MAIEKRLNSKQQTTTKQLMQSSYQDFTQHCVFVCVCVLHLACHSSSAIIDSSHHSLLLVKRSLVVSFIYSDGLLARAIYLELCMSIWNLHTLNWQYNKNNKMRVSKVKKIKKKCNNIWKTSGAQSKACRNVNKWAANKCRLWKLSLKYTNIQMCAVHVCVWMYHKYTAVRDVWVCV